MFSNEILIRNLDLHQASGNIALRAVNDETRLREWMRAGVKLVNRAGA